MTEDSTTPAHTEASASHSRLLLLITLGFVALCCTLGIWQLERAWQKSTLQQQLSSRTQDSALSITQLLQLPQQDNFPVAVHGHFDNAHSLLLDNRLLNGVAGYELVTPFITNDGHALLVNRGWLPRGTKRDQLPAIAPVNGEVQLRGITHQPTTNIFLPRADSATPDSWPVRVIQLDPALISQWLGQSLLPVALRLDADIHLQQPPLPRHWQQPARFTPARHLGYAVQWFLFALIALGIYLWRSRYWRKSSSHNETSV